MNSIIKNSEQITHTNKSIFKLLALVWGVIITILLITQFLGGPLGMSVYPTGEDRVWIDLLSKPGLGVFRNWWAIASRNPLAPWWYEVFYPLIHSFPYGLYIARKILDLFLAVSVVLLINELNKGRRPTLALACGLLVLLWNFSGHYIEQIIFVMLIALGFSLLSVYFYIRYLNSRRTVAEYLAFSLLTFLVALATYSIQSGVPLAVALLGAAYGRKGLPENSPPHPLMRNLTDIGFFAAIFVIFTQIWITTSGPTSSFFKLDLELFIKQFWASLSNFVWHVDSTLLTNSLFTQWPMLLIIILFTIAGFLFYRLLLWSITKHIPLSTLVDEPHGWRNPLWLGVLIVICLVLPTIAIETTSTIWQPGTRSRMVQQVFQPLVYISIIYAVITLLNKKWGEQLQAIIIACLCAFGLMLGAEYNRQLIELSRYEQGLVSGLKKLVPSINKPTHFFVRIDNADWYGGRNTELNRILVQQAYQSQSVWLNAVFKGNADPIRTVILGSDEQGVFSPSTQSYVPYSQSFFMAYDGKTLTSLNSVDIATPGYQAEITQSDGHQLDTNAFSPKASCPTTIDFDVKPHGQGWSVPEKTTSGDSFIWMAAKNSTVELSTTCKGAIKITFRTLQPISSEIQNTLKLAAAGKNIPVKVISFKDGVTEYKAVVPANILSSNGKLTLSFSVDETITPPEGTRELAIPFDWIRLD